MNNSVRKFLDKFILNISDENVEQSQESLIKNVLNNREQLNFVINTKINGIPLIFLIHHTYPDAINVFSVNNNDLYSINLIIALRKNLLDIRDIYTNDIHVYNNFSVRIDDDDDKQWEGIFKTSSFKRNPIDSNISTEGYVVRALKAQLAILDIKEGKPFTLYNNASLKENIHRVKDAHFFLNPAEVIDVYEYFLGKSDEQKTFSWNLLNFVPKNEKLNNYKDIINFFGNDLKDDFTKCISEIFSYHDNINVGVSASKLPKGILPELLPYVINNLHHYCRKSDDTSFIKEQIGTKYITLSWIQSCSNSSDEPLLIKFKNYLEQFEAHYIKEYCLDSELDEDGNYHYDEEEDAFLLDIKRGLNEQFTKIKIKDIEKDVEMKHNTLKKRKIF
jgi:hypothetical protein